MDRSVVSLDEPRRVRSPSTSGRLATLAISHASTRLTPVRKNGRVAPSGVSLERRDRPARGVPPIRRTRMFASAFPPKSLLFALLVALALVLCAPAPGARAHAGDATALAAAAATGGDPYVAAVGDMGCSPSNPNYNNGNGTATRCRQKYVSDLLVSPVPDALLLPRRQPVRQGRAGRTSRRSTTRPSGAPTRSPTRASATPSTTRPAPRASSTTSRASGSPARIGTTAGADASNYASGYYSFDIGAWHLIALNSNCAEVGGCGTGSPQEMWLKNDLAAHPNHCTLAYWHHPRWNSGALGNDSVDPPPSGPTSTTPSADIVLNGHGNHHYERFTPQNATGTPDAPTASASSSSAPAASRTARRRHRPATDDTTRGQPTTRASACSS